MSMRFLRNKADFEWLWLRQGETLYSKNDRPACPVRNRAGVVPVCLRNMVIK